MARLVKTVFDKPWIPYKNKVEFYLSGDSDFDAPVTTVHGLFFNEHKEFLLVKHRKRGWEVPGGHIIPGELYEGAMHRELYEEAQMKVGGLSQLGYLKKIALEDKPIGCEYPHPLSYCIFYAGEISEIDYFIGDDSIVDAQFFELGAAAKTPWIVSYKEYFSAAIELLS